MGERLKPAVLKTVSLERGSGVRIPLPPPTEYHMIDSLDIEVRRPFAANYLPRALRLLFLRGTFELLL